MHRRPQSSHALRSVALLACSLTAVNATALADDDASRLAVSPTRFTAQPAPQSTTPPPADTAPRGDYGDEGTQWLTIGGGAAFDFESATDSNLHLAWSTFLVKDVEFGIEAGGWYFNQPGDNTGGVSGTLLFRWHFVNTGKWTVFADAGIGVLGAFDDVPDTGTSLNVLPRAGAGVTRQISDSGTRLELGIRWHHISNARINGDDENPARDGAMFYTGVIFPF